VAVSAASFVVSAAPTESATVDPTGVVPAVSAAFESIAVESTASTVLSSSPSSTLRSSWSSSSLVAPPLPSSERRQKGGDGPARVRARSAGGAGHGFRLRVPCCMDRSRTWALSHGPQPHGRCRMGRGRMGRCRVGCCRAGRSDPRHSDPPPRPCQCARLGSRVQAGSWDLWSCIRLICSLI
jgi:hypothetical protein